MLQDKITQLLKERGYLSEEKIASLVQEAELKHKNFEELLVARKLVEEEKLTEIRGEILNFPYVNLFGRKIDPAILKIVSREVAKNYQIISFGLIEQELKVGVVDPQNFKAIEAIQFLAEEQHLKVKYFIISATSFFAAFRQYETMGAELEEAVEIAKERLVPPAGEEEKVELAGVLRRAPVSKIVSVIIQHAAEGNASDIHIEPIENETRVRYRIDGVLHTSLVLPIYLHPSIVSRIKVLANLKLDETRAPQDGRFREKIGEREIDIRVSTMPLLDKEKVVMRLLETSFKVPTLKELGFRERYVGTIEKNSKKPHGLFLLTGPVGSGKSTTLYAILNLVNREGVNIVTLEDPIEYYVPGINQGQVNPEVGFTFASGLRSLLRQDPNVIMVGEIRDQETAELAVHAGLTGHLIFSTLHTKDVFGVVPRLIDFGIEPFLITATLNAAVAQRLVRKICEHCKEKVSLPVALERNLRQEILGVSRDLLPGSLSLSHPLIFYRGKGCAHCGNSGYKGRTVVSEILEMTDQLAKIILSGYHTDEVRKEAQRQGMLTLRQDAILKALEGITSIEEVVRLTEEQ